MQSNPRFRVQTTDAIMTQFTPVYTRLYCNISIFSEYKPKVAYMLVTQCSWLQLMFVSFRLYYSSNWVIDYQSICLDPELRLDCNLQHIDITRIVENKGKFSTNNLLHLSDLIMIEGNIIHISQLILHQNQNNIMRYYVIPKSILGKMDW